MSVAPIRPDTFDQAMRGALSAGLNWPVKLRYAHSLHEAGLLHPVDPIHRDRADLVDAWKAQALETPADVIARHRHRWPELATYGAMIAAAMLAGTGWL